MTTETSTYVPQPGTIAARVLAHLAKLPAGAMQSGAVIADALDFDGEIAPYMLPAHEHGLVTREKRDGRWWWGVGHPQLRPLGAPPPVTADEDEIDDAPMVRRTVPARATGVSLVDVPAWSPPIAPAPKESAMNKPATPPQSTKKPRAASPDFDPLAIELKQRPLPPAVTAAASRYQQLLERMKTGDSIDVSPAIAKGLVSAAKRAKVKLATRVLSDTVTGVWRL